MLKTDYNIPIFEDTDSADLNKYSTEMANALKTQLNNTSEELKDIDRKIENAVSEFSKPLIYKGSVSTYQDLPTMATSGDIYTVTTENKNYIWNGTIWAEYASTLDLSGLINALTNNKATVTGSNITLNDSAEARVEEIHIRGNSVQDGTPTPVSPVERKSCGDNGSINETICNSNLGELEIGNYNDTDGSVMDSTKAYRSFIKVLSAGKYYIYYDFNYTGLGVDLLNIGARLYDRNNNLISTKTLTNNYIEITEAEIKAGAKWLKIKFFNTSITSISLDYIKKFQVNYLTSKEYEEHKSQTYTIPTQKPFRAIGDYKDIFIKQDGVWYEKHCIGKIVFDGTEGWEKSSRTDVNRYFIKTAVNSITGVNTLRAFSNLFEAITTQQSDNGGFGIASYNNTGFMINIDIANTSLDTLEKFKQLLNTKKLIVNYVLEIPELIPCTTEQIIKLNELQSLAKTYKNTTHIYSKDEVSPEIEVTYYKDIETMLNNA